MVQLITDIQLTETGLTMLRDTSNLIEDTAFLRGVYGDVFRKNNVTPDEFKQSLNYYVANIDKLDEIYAVVLANITKQDAKYKSIREKEIADSVKLKTPGLPKVDTAKQKKDTVKPNTGIVKPGKPLDIPKREITNPIEPNRRGARLELESERRAREAANKK